MVVMDAAAGRRLEDKLDRVLDAVAELSRRVGALEHAAAPRRARQSPQSPDSAALWARVHEIARRIETDPEHQRRHAEFRARYEDDPDGPIRRLIEMHERQR